MNYPKNEMPPLEQERLTSHLLSLLCMIQEIEKTESDEALASHYRLIKVDIENAIGRQRTFILDKLTVSPNF